MESSHYSEKINALHQQVEGAARQALLHAIECGKVLREAKDKIGHGEWAPWVELNCACSLRTTQNYMRVAKAFSKTQPPAHLTLERALAFLRDSRSKTPHLFAELLFPSEADRLGAMKADIQERGQQGPIITLEGQILFGQASLYGVPGTSDSPGNLAVGEVGAPHGAGGISAPHQKAG